MVQAQEAYGQEIYTIFL